MCAVESLFTNYQVVSARHAGLLYTLLYTTELITLRIWGTAVLDTLRCISQRLRLLTSTRSLAALKHDSRTARAQRSGDLAYSRVSVRSSSATEELSRAKINAVKIQQGKAAAAWVVEETKTLADGWWEYGM